MQLRSELDSEDDILNSEISVNTTCGYITCSVGNSPPTGFGINIVAADSEVHKNSNKRNIEFSF